MSDMQIALADEFIKEHYRFIVHPRERPTITEILELTAVAGDFHVLVIDPWNRLESQRNKNETETEYIAWCLGELRLFAVQYNCHVQIIAHPAKRDIRYRDEFPILEDISGSKHWDNLPDQGFCVHRPAFVDENGNRCWDAELHHLKSRFEELGYPCNFDMRLNPRTWRFEVTA
jgi:twinkle protein